MGYYTHFNLETKALGGPIEFPQCEHTTVESADFCHVCGVPIGAVSIKERIEAEIGANEYMDYAFNVGERVKWYSHEPDMRELSLSFPAVLFTLSGKGEEGGDLWRKYFLNGKCQVAKARIEYDGFIPEKLK